MVIVCPTRGETADGGLSHGGYPWGEYFLSTRLAKYFLNIRSQREKILARTSGGSGGESSLGTLLNTRELGIQTVRFKVRTVFLGQFGAVSWKEIDQPGH
jgi:hypothetical protein